MQRQKIETLKLEQPKQIKSFESEQLKEMQEFKEAHLKTTMKELKEDDTPYNKLRIIQF